MKKSIFNFLRAGVVRLAVVSFAACVFNVAAHAEDISVLNGGGITFSASDGWEAKQGAGASGGYAAYISNPSSTPATLTAKVKGAGTLTFRWKYTRWFNVRMHVNEDYENLSSGAVSGDKWYEKTVVIYAAAGEEQTIEWMQYATYGTLVLSDFRWTPAPSVFTVNYEVNGGEELSSDEFYSSSYLYYDDLPVPYREDCAFAGWYSDTNLVKFLEVVVPPFDQTLYAKWGAPVSVLDTDAVTFGTDVHWIAVEGEGASGGYAMFNDCGRGYLYAFLDGPGTLTFKNKWEEDASLSMYVDWNWVQFQMNESKQWHEHSVVVYGTGREIEWETYAGKIWLSDFEWTPAPKSFAVKFETNGGVELDDLIVYSASNALTYADMPVPEREGCEFRGWFLDSALTKIVADDDLVPLHEQTLYAKWSLPVSAMDAEGLQFHYEEDEGAPAWSVSEGAGFSGGPALEMVKCGWDKSHNVYVRCTNGIGTISFRWRSTAFTSVSAYLTEIYGEFEIGVGDKYKWYYASDANWREGKIDILNADDGEVEVSIYGYVSDTPGVIQLSDFKWTPAPETLQINFETRGGGTCEPMVVNPGQTVYAKDLPIPTHGDWTFAGWYIPGDYNWIAEPVDVIDVSLSDVTVYAQWKLPVSVFDEDGVAFKPTGDCYATVGGWDWMTPWWTMQADSNLCANIEIPWDGKDFKPKAKTSAMTATVRGPAIVSFDMTFDVLDALLMDYYSASEDLERFYRGSAKFSLSLDGKKLLEWSESSSEHNEKISIPAGTHKLVFELSGTPTLLDWGYGDSYDFSPSATVNNFKYLEVVPQETFGVWANTLRDNGVWIKGDLPRFVKAYEERLAANPADYEARVLHAVAILAQLAESKTVADYAKKFGFTLDYLRMKVDGSLAKPSSWPAANAMVDQFVKEVVPVIKDALADLEAIPADWTGTVLLSADEYPVDEDVAIDIGDVLYARAGLEASVGLAYFAHGYDLTVDYAKADKARASGDAVAFKLLTEQTKFMAKVRNAPSLSLSKSWMATALNRALLADAAVLARVDDAMHFIEYDLVTDGDMIDKARNLTQKALASLDAPQGIDVQNEVLGDKEVSFDVTLLPVGDDGLLQVYLGALFEGKIARDLLPTFQKGVDGSPVPVMETIKDATICGLLPDFTVRDWTRILRDIDRQVAHQTVVVKLDGNGGKVKPNTLSLDYDEEAEGCFYPELPVPAERQGYLFVGWATAKTGGTEVCAGDEYDASLFAGAKTPTLYAQWMKLYKVTLKDKAASASWAWAEDQAALAQWCEDLGCKPAYAPDAKGVMMVPPGAIVGITAPKSSTNAKGNVLTFQKWTVTPAKSYLGAYFRAGSSETEFAMPSADITLQAAYIDASTCGSLTANAYARDVQFGWNAEAEEPYTIEPPYEAFEWSPDSGKTWYKSGTNALLKAGSYTVTWRSSDPNWLAPSSKTKTTVAVGVENELEGDFTFTYLAQVVVDVMTFENGKFHASAVAGTVTMNPKDGFVQVGKIASLTAKAAKGYAFQGWLLADTDDWTYDSGFWAESATWQFENAEVSATLFSFSLNDYLDPADRKVHVKAVFKSFTAYRPEDIVFNGIGIYGYPGYYDNYSQASDDGSGNVTVAIPAVVGCALDNLKIDCGLAATPLTYKVNGKLPDGLKLDAKTGTFTGVPKKDGDFRVTVVATDPAGNAKSLVVNIHVDPLPPWIVGEFRGSVGGAYYNDGYWEWDEESQTSYWVDGEFECVVGQREGVLELSVKSDGKVSAKVITRIGTRSFSGTLHWMTSDGEQPKSEFLFEQTDKDGLYCNVRFDSDGTISGEVDLYDKTLQKGVGGYMTGLRHDKALLAKSNFLDKYYTFAFHAALLIQQEEMSEPAGFEMASGHGYLTIKTDKKGGAKVTGQLPDGEKVSMSALVMPYLIDEESEPTADNIAAHLYLFASPSAYKKMDWFAMTLTLNPNGSVASDENAAWTVADYYGPCDYFEWATITGEGALYSAAQTLEGHYWNIVCGYSEEVTADYVDKVADALEAPMAEQFGDDDPMFFDVSLKGTAKGEIALVAKSPAPWNDGKVWHFDVDKKRKDITDPSQLSFSFAKATGIFSGKATVYFGYDDQNTDKTVLKTTTLPFNGIVINTPTEDGVVREGFGAAVYSGKSYKKDENTGKWKEIKTTVSLPVTLEPKAAEEP